MFDQDPADRPIDRDEYEAWEKAQKILTPASLAAQCRGPGGVSPARAPDQAPELLPNEETP